MLNVSGLVVPQLTRLSYKTIQNIINYTHLPTIVAQNSLTNIATSDDDILIWRSTTSELVDIIQSLLEHLCPAIVVLVERTDDVAVSLSSVLPNKLTLSANTTVDVMIVQYNGNDNLPDKIETAIINASLMINTSSTITASCTQRHSQSGSVFILNSPAYDANTILTVVSMQEPFAMFSIS